MCTRTLSVKTFLLFLISHKELKVKQLKGEESSEIKNRVKITVNTIVVVVVVIIYYILSILIGFCMCAIQGYFLCSIELCLFHIKDSAKLSYKKVQFHLKEDFFNRCQPCPVTLSKCLGHYCVFEFDICALKHLSNYIDSREVFSISWLMINSTRLGLDSQGESRERC